MDYRIDEIFELIERRFPRPLNLKQLADSGTYGNFPAASGNGLVLSIARKRSRKTAALNSTKR